MNDWDDSPSKNRGAGCAGSAGIIMGIVALLLVLALGVVIFQGQLCNYLSLPNCPPKRPVVNIGQYLEKANQLTTVKFTDVFIMDAKEENVIDAIFIDIPIGALTVVYAVYGEVWAGVNLDEIDPNSVLIEEESVTISLPAPEIQNAGNVIVESRSEKYVYQEGFPPSNTTAIALTEELEQYASNQIINDACNAGILDEANKNAELVLQVLFETAGFTEVNIITQSGHCP